VKQVLLSESRGGADHGWLRSKHSFSFADYYNPKLMGFGDLRVINEDWIAGGTGFPLHGHQNMEIITVVLSGALEHKDTLGTSAVIRPGEVQYMAAGTGIRHSEFNHLTGQGEDQRTHLYQIWILPDREGYSPRYDQKSFADKFAREKMTLVASSDGRDASIEIHQKADMWVGNLKSGETFRHELAAGRRAWVQVIEGELKVSGESLRGGDALALVDETEIAFATVNLVGSGPGAVAGSGARDVKARFILFDLP
jgi:redox-sensitive bicupin YhaK (pirin superfamily)